jgi:hypothetical protein
VRQLWKDVAYLRRARREVRDRVHSEWERERKWRPRWWDRLLTWCGAALGVYLLLSGDTIERVLGVGLVVGPAVIMAVSVWVYWKALRILRQERQAKAGCE